MVGDTDAGERFSLRIQCADCREAPGSNNNMNVGGRVVVLDGDRSSAQSQAAKHEDQM